MTQNGCFLGEELNLEDLFTNFSLTNLEIHLVFGLGKTIKIKQNNLNELNLVGTRFRGLELYQVFHEVTLSKSLKSLVGCSFRIHVVNKERSMYFSYLQFHRKLKMCLSAKSISHKI